MRLQFGKEKTQIQVDRDPKTQELRLTLEDELELPLLNFGVRVYSNIGTEAAIQLRDQIDALLAGDQTQSRAL